MSTNCPIAIVGMACRYPDANNVKQLFENSLAQRRAFRRMPESRLGAAYFDESGQAVDRAYARQAALINGFRFDRDWFRVSKASYEVTDMTHWLALTVAREAIESIRLKNSDKPIASEAVRVVVGNTLTGEFSRAHQMRLRWPYVRKLVAQQLREEHPNLADSEIQRQLRTLEARYKSPFPVPNEEFLAGGLANTIAGRICNHFDFKGGGYTVDGACSSSLLAVTDACSALLTGDADMVLAGGVDLSLDPFELVGFSRTAALARNDMLVYDQHSEGFWPGEGCGFVALMRYEDALAQCQQIHAVIQGWGVSSDGRGGLTRPEAAGQMLAISRCYQRAGYSVADVGYFEGHGTGTKVGDTAELQALISARQQSGQLRQAAVISSIKANIGHTKAAAGLAGLLRATMAVSQQILPATTACRQPHSLLLEHPDNLRVSAQPQEWHSQTPRRAAVSAMGFGGINTHITLEETPQRADRPTRLFASAELTSFAAVQDAELFLFSFYSHADLLWTVQHLSNFASACSRAELCDLAAEMAQRATRGALSQWKAAIVASTPAQLHEKLRILAQRLQEITASEADQNQTCQLDGSNGIFLVGGNQSKRIGLIFSGQGSPARGDGGIFAQRFAEVAQLYQDAQLPIHGNTQQADFVQPAIATASLAGLALLERLGVNAHLALGHSLGELAALHWAGCYDGATLLDIAKVRGQATCQAKDSQGAMLAVQADETRTRAAIADNAQLYIANLNSPQQTIVSGAKADVEAFAARLPSLGLKASLLPVRHAFHTPHMQEVADTLERALTSQHFQPVQRKVISTVSAQPMPEALTIASYLREQLTAPVQFFDAVKRAAGEVEVLLEVGPGEIVSNLLSQAITTPIFPLDIGGKSFTPFLKAAAAAFVCNAAPNISALFEKRFTRRFDWSWQPQFFANPCENSQADSEAENATTEWQEAPLAPLTDEAPDNAAPMCGDSTLEHLRAMIATRAGLPTWTIQDNSRMLSDLHLNSITVGEIIAQLSRARQLSVPRGLTEFANASLLEIAHALDQLTPASPDHAPAASTVAAGVGSWVRYFDVVRVPSAMPKTADAAHTTLTQGHWQGAEQYVFEPLLRHLNRYAFGYGVIAYLSENPSQDEYLQLLSAAQSCLNQARENLAQPWHFVVLQRGWGGSSFVKSFSLEHPHLRCIVINLDSLRNPIELISAEISHAQAGYQEFFYDNEGQRSAPQLRLVTLPQERAQASSTARRLHLLDAQDVVLVTGGGKGISAECGLQLARQTGCALLILGRSPLASNAELASNLQRMQEAGVQVHYVQADVCEANEVALALAEGKSHFARPITGFIHGAGINQPCTIEHLQGQALLATLAPKIEGLHNVLAALEPRELKLLVSFSSIIGRIGLHGEGDYALANEALSHATRQFQQRYPQCRCRAIEWSVWSGTGMGQKLGRVEALLDEGISPISIDDGVQEFLRLVQADDLPSCLVVSGRFGQPTGLTMAAPLYTEGRFLSKLAVYYPGVELVAECQLSTANDVYLEEHMLNGERIFPAVMALEAMSQAAHCLLRKAPGSLDLQFKNISFRQAIVIPEGEAGLTLRIAALRQENGEIQFALRCSSSHFQSNHIEASCFVQPAASDSIALQNLSAHGVPQELQDMLKQHVQTALPPLSGDSAHALYQHLLFQRGRFKRIQAYCLIEARRCLANLSSTPDASWFAPELCTNLLLGDAGVRDAALHGIQACIPHKIVIPISVASITSTTLAAPAYQLLAYELADLGDELVYDMFILDQHGVALEYWQQLRLRVVGAPQQLRLSAAPLLISYLERQLASEYPQAGVTLRLNTLQERSWRNAPSALHRPDGKPDAMPNGQIQSFSYSAHWQLHAQVAALTGARLGCDLQEVLPKSAESWQDLLGNEGFQLAQVCASMMRESLDQAGCRIWSAREAMKKAGLPADAPLSLRPGAGAQLLILRSGEMLIFSAVTHVPTEQQALCVTVAVHAASAPPC